MIATASVTTPSTRRVPHGLAPAGLVLCGALLSLVGMAWDIQWHNDVGPDTFFTLPHLVLYLGSATAGLTSLAVVLATTAARRQGRPIDPSVGGRPVGVFGRTFTAPVGYLVAGTGAALFLLYGLWDEWWHSLYGFDVMLASPPHNGLLLSIQLTMTGALVVFASARERRWGAIGIIMTISTSVAFGVVTTAGVEGLPIDDDIAAPVGTVFMCALLVTLAARALDWLGSAVTVAVVVAAIQAVLWWFAPWATRVYANASGLPLRDYTEGVSQHAARIPMLLVVFGVLVAALRRQPAWLVGGIGGAVLGVAAPLQQAWLYGLDRPATADVIVVATVAALLAALAGFLGARCAEILRHVMRQEASHA
ncbi:hypothetical protein ACQEVC_04960 [Plantactinospora sp. CA-294935]|uniref:hypothetical protein n=1 Tax=Plantactinospora sp. CA-294935 TaxID=3240012 RepID=UPI003D8A4E8A